MSQIDYPPVLEMHQNLKRLSADPHERMLARDRERALNDELSELSAAREEGKEEGKEEGRKEGREAGIDVGVEQSVQRLMARGISEQAARAMLAPVEPGNGS